MEIEYYGTLLDQAGHGFYTLTKDFDRNRTRFENLPFNPEGLPYHSREKNYIDGVARFYNVFGFTICAIAGSPYDKRGGSKSIFFIEEELTREVFKERLNANSVFQKIIKQMPFEVRWENF